MRIGNYDIRITSAKAAPGENTQWFPVGQTGGSFDEGDDYENVYGNVSAISKAGRVVLPYLNNEKGEQYTQEHNVTNVLYKPNKDLSAEEFRDYLFISYLLKPKTYVRIHYKNGAVRRNDTIDADKITGFTFLENLTELPRTRDGKRQYRTGTTTLQENEVMSLGGINPTNISAGYSPLQATRRWTRIEDFLSDSQAAFFRNGAVPAGMFIINADTPQQFKDIKRLLQKNARGAKNNNNVLYNWRQPDVTGGASTQDQIVWVPFNVTNKDLALKDLHEIVQRKQNDAFGVSAVIKGNVDETTYASAMVVEKFFVKYTLYPVVSAIWNRFSHELNRCTGGFGFSIGFDLEIPILGDELIQRAEAKSKDADTILKLHEKFTINSIVDAFDYPEEYKKLVPIEASSVVKSTTTQDAPPIDDDPSTQTASKALADDSRKSAQDQLELSLQDYTQEEIDQIIDHYLATGEIPETSEDSNGALEALLFASILILLTIQGRKDQASALSSLLKDNIAPSLPPYQPSLDVQNSYKAYLRNVADNYNTNLRKDVRVAIEKALAEGTKREDLKATLQKLGFGDYQAKRLANSEINRAGNNAALDAYRAVEAQMPDHYFVKIWVTDGPNPCPLCRSLDDTETTIDAPFILSDHHIRDEDGKDWQNKYVDMQTADAHPNCHCHLKFELRQY